MKLNSPLVALAFVATLLTTSCVDSMYGPGVPMSYGSRVTTYTTLSPGYSGSAFHHNGRYCSGGKLESGNYAHQGRHYSNRYYHNGHYLYGDNHQHYHGTPFYGYSRSLNWPSIYPGSSSSPYHLRYPSAGRPL